MRMRMMVVAMRSEASEMSRHAYYILLIQYYVSETRTLHEVHCPLPCPC